MFVGRENELKEINAAINSDTFQSILIYGRRRVGKSEIIKEATKNINKRTIYFECKKTSNISNLKSLSQLFKKTFNLVNLNFENWDELFDYIFNYSIKNEFILIIDEFSFLLEDDFSIESSLAIAIDKYKNDSKLKLIISGSYVTLIKRLIEYNSHCYGRFYHILLIKPFDYYTVSKFYENYNDEDKVKIYSVFGGMPYFNSLIDKTKTADENIINLLVKKDSILEHEINEMILMETSKISLLNELICIIGSGVNKYKDIKAILNQYKGSRPEYLLNKLVEMNIVSKTTPINDKNNLKKMFYVFNDNLIHFYYKYLFNSPYSINRDNPAFFYENFIKQDFEQNYIPKIFEKIVKEFLLKKNFENYFPYPLMDIGTYFFDDAKKKINLQFDVVTKDINGYVSFECKYTNSKIGMSEIKEEEKQTNSATNIAFYKLGFVSKKGFNNDIDKENYYCFSLQDIYK